MLAARPGFLGHVLSAPGTRRFRGDLLLLGAKPAHGPVCGQDFMGLTQRLVTNVTGIQLLAACKPEPSIRLAIVLASPILG